jgi:quinol monooxygenase YgiN
MKCTIFAFLIALPLCGSWSSGTSAQDVPRPPLTGEVQVVGFLQVSPVMIPDAIEAMKRYRTSSLPEPGAKAIRLFEELARPERLMVIETWSDQASYDAHAAGPACTLLRTSLQRMEIGAVDIRLHRVLIAKPSGSDHVVSQSKGATDSVFVMTHLDVPPPFFADLQEPLRSYVEAETKAPGVNSVEILQHVAPRQNHLTMLEAWGSRADLDTQRSGSASIEFRNKIVPLLGALYDERLYRAVD